VVKVELIKGKDTTKLYFETRLTTPDGLDELDEVYQALLGSGDKTGGYIDSNKFVIEVKNE
jgi:hypothetical protein